VRGGEHAHDAQNYSGEARPTRVTRKVRWPPILTSPAFAGGKEEQRLAQKALLSSTVGAVRIEIRATGGEAVFWDNDALDGDHRRAYFEREARG